MLRKDGRRRGYAIRVINSEETVDKTNQPDAIEPTDAWAGKKSHRRSKLFLFVSLLLPAALFSATACTFGNLLERSAMAAPGGTIGGTSLVW